MFVLVQVATFVTFVDALSGVFSSFKSLKLEASCGLPKGHTSAKSFDLVLMSCQGFLRPRAVTCERPDLALRDPKFRSCAANWVIVLNSSQAYQQFRPQKTRLLGKLNFVILSQDCVRQPLLRELSSRLVFSLRPGQVVRCQLRMVRMKLRKCGNVCRLVIHIRSISGAMQGFEPWCLQTHCPMLVF